MKSFRTGPAFENVSHRTCFMKMLCKGPATPKSFAKDLLHQEVSQGTCSLKTFTTDFATVRRSYHCWNPRKSIFSQTACYLELKPWCVENCENAITILYGTGADTRQLTFNHFFHRPRSILHPAWPLLHPSTLHHRGTLKHLHPQPLNSSNPKQGVMCSLSFYIWSKLKKKYGFLLGQIKGNSCKRRQVRHQIDQPRLG